MLSRLFLALALLLGGTGLSRAVHVVMCGGPALRQWEGLRIQPDRHDNWWANFVRASTIRIAQIQQQDPAARITWIVYRPGYATRGKEDGKPYTRWIADLASKYKIRLVWVNSADQAIRALNSSPRFHGDAAVRLLELRLLYGSQHVPLVETHRRRPPLGQHGIHPLRPRL